MTICTFCKDTILPGENITTTVCNCKYHNDCIIYLLKNKQCNHCLLHSNNFIISRLSEIIRIKKSTSIITLNIKEMDNIYNFHKTISTSFPSEVWDSQFIINQNFTEI